MNLLRWLGKQQHQKYHQNIATKGHERKHHHSANRIKFPSNLTKPYTTWKGSMASHFHVLVYHGPLQIAPFWEWLAIDPFQTTHPSNVNFNCRDSAAPHSFPLWEIYPVELLKWLSPTHRKKHKKLSGPFPC